VTESKDVNTSHQSIAVVIVLNRNTTHTRATYINSTPADMSGLVFQLTVKVKYQGQL